MKKNLLLIMLAGASLLTAGIGYAGAPSRVDDGPTTDPTTPEPVQIQKVSPANGKTLKSLAAVAFYFKSADATDLNTGNDILRPSDLSKIYITKQGSTDHLVATSLGDKEMDETDFQNPLDILTINFDVITEAGTYTIHADEGAFVEVAFNASDDKFEPVQNGRKSAEFSSTFIIDPAYNVFDLNLLTPGNNDKVGSLESFTLDFQELSENVYYQVNLDDTKNPTITGPAQSGVENATVYVGQGGNRSGSLCFEIVFQDSEEEPITFTELGDYTLTIPAGYFTYDGTQSKEITAKVTVVAPVQLTVTPQSGSTLRAIRQISLVYDFDNNPFIQPNVEMLDQVKLTPKNGGEAITPSSVGEGGENGWPLIFDTPVTTEGEYTLTVPAGFFTEMIGFTDFMGNEQTIAKPTNAVKSAALTATYTISKSVSTMFGDYTLDPANDKTVKDISTIAITFPNIADEAQSQLWGAAQNTISISKGTDTYAGSAMRDWTYEGQGMKFNISFMDASQEPIEAITADGDWTLTIKAGAFSFGNDVSDPITAVYHVDHTVGVAEIEGAEDGSVTVVSIDGKVLLRNAPADAVNGLENGLYIVNGKKVLVKK